MRHAFLETDVPTKETGRIYPRTEVERAINNIGENGLFAGIDLASGELISLANITHKVKDIEIADDGKVSAIFTLVSSPKGGELQEAITEGNVRFTPVGHGFVDDNNIISDYEIIGFEVKINDE